MAEDEAPAACDRQLGGALDDGGMRAIAERVGQADLHPEGSAEERQRVVDVVAVTDEREHEPVEPPESFAEGEDVGERLAGMLAERQAVDDRDRGLGGELDDDGMRSGPGHDGIDEPLEVEGDVPNALAGAHDDVLGEIDRMSAELVHAGLERHAGAEAGALEEHRERPPGEWRRRVSAERAVLRLERLRAIKDPNDLVSRQIRNGQQVAAAQRSPLVNGVHPPTLTAAA